VNRWLHILEKSAKEEVGCLLRNDGKANGYFAIGRPGVDALCSWLWNSSAGRFGVKRRASLKIDKEDWFQEIC
jgi:hypothetical protein